MSRLRQHRASTDLSIDPYRVRFCSRSITSCSDRIRNRLCSRCLGTLGAPTRIHDRQRCCVIRHRAGWRSCRRLRQTSRQAQTRRKTTNCRRVDHAIDLDRRLYRRDDARRLERRVPQHHSLHRSGNRHLRSYEPRSSIADHRKPLNPSDSKVERPLMMIWGLAIKEFVPLQLILDARRNNSSATFSAVPNRLVDHVGQSQRWSVPKVVFRSRQIIFVERRIRRQINR